MYKTFSMEHGGQRKKKIHGFGVSEQKVVLEPFTIVIIFFYFCTMKRDIAVRDGAFPKACVLCSWEGQPNRHGIHNTKQLHSRLKNVFARAVPPWLHMPKREQPRFTFFFNTKNKNAASKRSRQHFHRFQWGTQPSAHTNPLSKNNKIKYCGTRFSQRRRDKFNVQKHSQCNLCFKSIPPRGSKGKRARACQKVTNNNQQITN